MYKKNYQYSISAIRYKLLNTINKPFSSIILFYCIILLYLYELIQPLAAIRNKPLNG